MSKARELLLKRANAHIITNLELRENSHSRWERCFVILNSKGEIRGAKPTKRGSESKKSELEAISYYDDYRQKMVEPNRNSLVIERVDLSELLPLDNEQLWYNTMWNEYKQLGGGSFNFKKFHWIIRKNKLPTKFISIVTVFGKDAEKGSFSIADELEPKKVDLRDLDY